MALFDGIANKYNQLSQDKFILEWNIETEIFIKRENADIGTHAEKMPCKDEGRSWDEASTSQGTPKIASKPQETRQEAWNRFF